MAEELTRGLPSTEHIRASLGFLLRSATIPWYDLATGEHTTAKLSDVCPGIIIRPAQRAYRDLPMIDLRESEETKPYVTWLRRPAQLGTESFYGAGEVEASLWEIDVRVGENKKIWDYDRLSDWFTGFLTQYNQMPIYFYHYDADAAMKASRGDQIAWSHVSQVIVADRAEVADARGDDGWIVLTFRMDIMKSGQESGEG